MTISNKKAELINEYMKCKNDFDYFCRNYVLLELAGGDIYLNPYKKQSELINLIQKFNYVCVLKSRQIGISTILKAFSTWLVIFYDNVVIGVISKDGRESTAFARDTRKMIDKLPKWIQPGYDKYTEQSFILNNGSKVFSAPVNPIAPENTLRGKAITFLIIDEAAFIPNMEKAWVSMVPALSSSASQARKVGIPYGTLVISTPNKTQGRGAWFYNKWQNAVTGNDIFKDFIIHWKMVDELASDPLWYKNTCSMFDNDPKKIQQELELKFLGTEGSFFPEETIMKLQENETEPIEKVKIFGGEIWKFAEAIKEKYYLIGVDTAPEFGEDKSAITIWDYQTLEQVWEYQTKCRVIDFVKVVKFACSQYPGVVVVENNSYGNQVMEELNNSEFSIMMYKERSSANIIKPGISTNIKTRPLMIDALYSYIVQFPESVKSKRLSMELIGLVEKGGKVQADLGCRDDLALSTAFSFYVRKYDPPLMIDSSKFHESMFSDIIDMNYKRSFTVSMDEDKTEEEMEIKKESMRQDLNVKIMRDVRENVFDFEKLYVNTMDYYKDR